MLKTVASYIQKMDTRNLKRPSAPILPLDGGPQRPHLGPVTRSVAAGKPRPDRRAANPKRHRAPSRRPDCFSEKYRRLMEAMGKSDEVTGGSGPGGPRDQGAHGGPHQQNPRHPDSYSVKFRTLMEVVIGRSEEKRAGPDGGNVTVATPTTEAKGGAEAEEHGGAQRESGGRGGQEKSGSEGPTPIQNEEEEEGEVHDDSAELDWMAAMVEALIDGELHQSQITEPEAFHTAPGPIGTERRSPGTWDGIGVTSDLEEYSFFEDVLTGRQLPIPPLSLGQNLDLGQDPLDDLSLSDWPFLSDADLFLSKPSEPNVQPGQGPIAPPSVPGNGVGHLEN